MSAETTLGGMTELLKPWTIASRSVSDTRLELETTAANIVPAASALKGAQWGFLSAITGLDNSTAAEPARNGGGFEVLYHFCRGPSVLTFRVKLPRETPTVPTLSAVVPSALIYEKELAETFGVIVEGIPEQEAPVPL